MKSFMKKTLACVLTLIMVCGTFVCSAAELNEEAVNEHYGQFKNYLLLGDSVASGYRDEMSDNDAAYNEANRETTYYRAPGSYADVLANAIIEDGSMTALAAPGFRTIEMRYMLEDEFAATCEDEYLFHPSHLYTYEDELAPDGSGEYLLPGAEYFRKQFKKSIAEADLITLGIGGNDWGAYLGWVINDILESEHVADEYIAMAKDVLDKSTMDIGTIEKLVEIASLAGAVPALLTQVPAALDYGLGNFYRNWDIMIQDIYDLNPDVTLMVLGMSDNSLKGKHYDYNGVEGEPVIPEGEEEDPAKAQVMSLIINFIMSIGNKPMIEGAEKFGYTYVDTDGTTYIDSHPDAAGHTFIANKIIEALPDAEISKRYEDVKPGHKYYNAVEYVLKNGIMKATSDTTFSPDEDLTNGQLTDAINAINGKETETEDSSKATALKLSIALFTNGLKKGFAGFLKGITLSFQVLSDNNFNIAASVTRAEAANYLSALAKA